MLKRLISVVLVAAIVACPWFCTKGQDRARATDEAYAGCCSCCKTAGEPASPAGPACPSHDRSPSSGKCCHCICGGAVMDDGLSLDVGIDTTFWLPAIFVQSMGTCLHGRYFQPIELAAWPDIGLNTGRALCCLFNTYLV